MIQAVPSPTQLVTQHPFFPFSRREPIPASGVQYFLNQYWHPIHFFPTFIASVIARTPVLAVKTALAPILDQELGLGNTQKAHETLYLETMEAAGFDAKAIQAAVPSRATLGLMELYRVGCEDWRIGLGLLFATEAIDLTIVAGLASAVRKHSRTPSLPWLDIHVQQEPDHTELSSLAVLADGISKTDREVIEIGKENGLRAWKGFFDDLHASSLRHVRN